jgi:hypothetical protein
MLSYNLQYSWKNKVTHIKLNNHLVAATLKAVINFKILIETQRDRHYYFYFVQNKTDAQCNQETLKELSVG